MNPQFDVHVLISILQDICKDTLLNTTQKDRFIETEVLKHLNLISEDDLPVLRAAWRMSV